MITKQDYTNIWKEIQSALEDTFNSIKEKSLSSYLLILANSEFNEVVLRDPTLNPCAIESELDNYLDYDRLNFLTDLLQAFYSFQDFDVVDDNLQRMHMELMTYTHIWESKPYLNKLYRIAHAIDNGSYKWSVSVPEKEKYKFIRDEIRKKINVEKCSISDFIKKGYHSSLRNAFAHSQYHFDENNKKIILSNYKGGNWEVREISFDEWHERFVYSALLTYHLYSILKRRKENILEEFNTVYFEISRPNRKGTQEYKVPIRYCVDNKEFYWNYE